MKLGNNNFGINFIDINAIDYPVDSNQITNNYKNNIHTSHYDTGILNLHFKIYTPINFEFNIKINKKNKALDLKKAIEEILKEKYKEEFDHINSDKIVIFTKNGVLKDEDVIETKEFVNEREILNVIIMEDNNMLTSENHNELEDNKEFEKLEDLSSFKSEFSYSLIDYPLDTDDRDSRSIYRRPEYCPIAFRYKTDPPMKDLIRMSREELEKVRNFTVYNEHGKIMFKNIPTDVTYLNLDEIITISPLFVDVYGNVDPPKLGEKLNKEARIFIYNFELPQEAQNSDEAYAEFILKIKEKLEEKNAQFMNYDSARAELMFDVNSFDRKIN
jgi:hypothetical protein